MPTVSASLLLAFMISPAAANTPVNLKWKFTEGDVLYVTCTEDTESSAIEKGKVVQSAVTLNVVNYKLAVTSVAEEGTSFELTFGRVSSAHAETRQGLKLVPHKDAKVGHSFTFILRPDGKVTKIRGNDALWNAAPGIQPEQTAEVLANHLFRTVPGKPLRRGDGWASEVGYPSANGYTEVKARSKVDSVADSVVKLVAEVDHSWDSRGQKTNTSFDELNGKDGSRTVWFDLKTGRVRKLEENYVMSGPMRAPWQNWIVTHREKQTIEVSDTPPKEE